MQSHRHPAASVLAALLAVTFLSAMVAGCKSRPEVPEDNGVGDPDNPGGNGTGTPDPAVLQQIRMLNEENESLRTENETLAQQLEDARSSWNDINRELDTLRGQKTTLQSDKAALDARIKALEGEKSELKIRIQQLEKDLANRPTDPVVAPSDPDVLPTTDPGERPEVAAGWVRHDPGTGFSFDCPEGWTVTANHDLESNEYQLTGPDGELMRITVWAYLKAEPEVLAGETWTARIEELTSKDITPTTEVELQEVEAGLAGTKTWHCQLLFDVEGGTTLRHRIAAAAMAIDEGDMFGTWYAVAVEYTWPATNDASLATYDEIVKTFFVQ